MTVHRLVRALLSEGLTDAVFDLLTNPGQPGWARLLDQGASFTWEAWELEDGTDYSQSHAWSASVIKEILESLLGVRVTVPGGSELLIEPPVCRLEHAKGSRPPAQRHRSGQLAADGRGNPAGMHGTGRRHGDRPAPRRHLRNQGADVGTRRRAFQRGLDQQPCNA